MIRDRAALDCARKILGQDASDTAVRLAASIIQNDVMRDEQKQKDEGYIPPALHRVQDDGASLYRAK